MKPGAIRPDSFPWFDYSRYSFSLGLSLGPDRATLSGHSASEYDPARSRIVVNGDMADQTRTAYRKIGTILRAAGLGFEDVTRVVENVTVAGVDHYAAAEAVRGEVFGSHRPAVNTVVVHRLLRPAALIEIEVTADRGGGRACAGGSGGRGAWAPARAAGDVVYLSTVLPYDDAGDLVGEGDPEAQVRQIFRNAERVLAACGLGMRNVVKTLEMIRPEALEGYRYTGRPRREFLGPVYPGAAGILQERVAGDDRVLISYDFTASRAEAAAVNPGWDRYQRLTYSPAVRAGHLLFMSGQAALDPETGRALFPGDVAAQAEYTYSNILKVLDAAGMGPRNLIKTIEYVTPEGLTGYRGVAGVRRRLLAEPWPASTGALCHSLLRKEFLIEIDPLAMALPS
jgi:enamine deaminase RidA (YjgF/YER057c/UK114 family)